MVGGALMGFHDVRFPLSLFLFLIVIAISS